MRRPIVTVSPVCSIEQFYFVEIKNEKSSLQFESIQLGNSNKSSSLRKKIEYCLRRVSDVLATFDSDTQIGASRGFLLGGG